MTTTYQEAFRLGQTIEKPVYGSLQEGVRPVLLLAAGKRIETVQQLLVLRRAGIPVELPDGACEDGEDEALASPGRNAGMLRALTFEQRMRQGRLLRKSVIGAANDLFRRLQESQEPDLPALLATSTHLAQQVADSPQAMVTLALLHHCDDYTIEHSADVAILMTAIARCSGHPESSLPEIALCGLMHDVGKQRIAKEILQKPGRLTNEEFAEIRRHPDLGHEILGRVPGCPESVRRVALEHHERLDGSGYPNGLKGEQIHRYSAIAGVADTFDAMTADRVYRRGLSPRAAIQELYRRRATQYCGEAVNSILKLIGIYPVGTWVLLSTGEQAIVAEPNPDALTAPMVDVVQDRLGRPLATPYRLELEGSACKIIGALTGERDREDDYSPLASAS